MKPSYALSALLCVVLLSGSPASSAERCESSKIDQQDFSAEISEWFPTPIEFSVQESNRTIAVARSPRSDVDERYRTGLSRVYGQLPKAKANWIAGSLKSAAQNQPGKLCMQILGESESPFLFRTARVSFEAVSARMTADPRIDASRDQSPSAYYMEELGSSVAIKCEYFGDNCRLIAAAVKSIPHEGSGLFNMATPICPAEVLAGLSCSFQQREAVLRRFYSQLTDSWIASAAAIAAQRQTAQDLLDSKLRAAGEEEQQRRAEEMKRMQDELRKKEEAEKLQAKRAAERETAHRADLVAGRIPVKTCNDAAIKFDAEDGQSVALLGHGDTARYYGFSNYLVVDTQRRENDRIYLLSIGSLRVAFRMGPGAVDQYAGGPLPVCAVGRFSGYADLKDGGKVAKFDGVYLGR